MNITPLGFPIAFGLLILQMVISLFWLRPAFQAGLLIYRRPIPVSAASPSETIAAEFLKLDLSTLAVRKLSDTEIGLRRSFPLGFTGVQGILSTAHPALFTARLGWPAVAFYAFALWMVWGHVAGSLASSATATLIVLAIPAIDLLQIRNAISKFAARVNSA